MNETPQPSGRNVFIEVPKVAADNDLYDFQTDWTAVANHLDIMVGNKQQMKAVVRDKEHQNNAKSWRRSYRRPEGKIDASGHTHTHAKEMQVTFLLLWKYELK